LLHVHRSERADRLADGLAETLTEPLADPFAAEVVAVPTRGIERWLTQRLSTRLGASPGRADGVCANIDFPFPGRLVLNSLASASDVDPDHDPWPAERLVWPLLELVDECIEEPWLAVLAAHLEGARGGPDDATRRFAVVRHIADLFDRYAVHRPEMVRQWLAGEAARTGEAGRTSEADGAQWQPELWRRLRHRIDQPSPAERLEHACVRIREQPDLLDLPARLSLFGLTRLPRSYLDVLAALGASRDVHLFVLHPSPALWEMVARETKQLPAKLVHRRTDPTTELATNRLLASWGRDARELQLVLEATTALSDRHHELSTDAPDTLLARIQDDVRRNTQPPGPPLPGQPEARPLLERGDRSIQVHACHGRARQVEILRDAVLHLLADDPTLEPRDVIVMCPDIETFAPLIQATFGEGQSHNEADDVEDAQGEAGANENHHLPDLRVRLADRSLRQTNPVLGVVSRLLELADQRATASQLLDLADREPVRRRFGFGDDDLARMQEWVQASGIRWGFDAEHRKPFKLDAVDAGTWRRGLDRLMLGVAMSEEDRRRVGGVLPLDDVESGVIDLAGRFAEFIDRAQGAVEALTGAKPVTAWTAAIATAADSLTSTSERDGWERTELQRLLDDVGREATGTTATLELADVRALLADRLRGRPTRANFRTGHLTICTLVPMRSVPHRVVCVLGLDDGEFPRRALRDGDDLMLQDPHVGDRDARSEDRQMLLDALMAATERLVITYTGNDERTNLPRPPAVPVGELLDVVDRTVRTAASDRARDQILIHHPLQPFDRRNFTAGALIPEDVWSFDLTSLKGSEALRSPRRAPGPFLANPLPRQSEPYIELERLVQFVENPVKAFLRGRLGVTVSEYLDEVQDALPVELDGLGQWGVGQRLLDGVLAGASLDDCAEAELARGTLPPGQLATPVLNTVRPVVERIAGAARTVSDAAATSFDVNLELPDGRTLAGTISGVCATTIRSVAYSRVKPRHRLAAWVKLLALSASRPDTAWEAAVIGRAREERRRIAAITVARIPPLGSDPDTRRHNALTELEVLVDLFDRGMREPLPMACETTAAYAQAAAQGEDPRDAAAGVWTSNFSYGKEDREPEHVLVRGGVATLSDLLAETPRADEALIGWVPSESSRFGRYAHRLWDGLLSYEQLLDR
jgi:exodeoxyribonuclease V gamma subunit